MNPVDIGAIAIIVVCGIGCAFRGIVRELLGKAAFFVGGLAAFLLWRPLAKALPLPANFAWASVISACLILFLAGFFAVKLIERGLHEGLEAMRMGALDHGLGFALGLLEGVLVSGLLVGLLAAQPFVDSSGLLSGSLFYDLVGPYADLGKYLKDV